MRHFSALRLLACTAILLGTAAVQAQAVRPFNTPYVTLRGGAAFYGGELDGADGFDIGAYVDDIGAGGGIELGYLFGKQLSLGVAFHYGHYGALDNVAEAGSLYNLIGIPVGEEINRDSNVYEAQFRARYLVLPSARLSPYVTLGGTYVAASPDISNPLDNVDPFENETGWGTLVGLGLDFQASPRLSLFLEGDTRFIFPDNVVDNINPGEFSAANAPFNTVFTTPASIASLQRAADSDDVDFDVLAHIGGGLRFAFKSPLIPVDATIDGPTALEVNESGTYTAFVNDDASGPLSYMWDFGDGATADGLTASHSYASPGTYTVSFTAAGPVNSDTETLLVTVTDPPVRAVAPSLSNCRATPNPAGIGEAVRFSASASGTDPITFRYDFGDGQTASTLNASNSYAAAGTYTATLTATNEMGSDQCTVVVTVINRRCENVTELNTVYFGYRMATLTDEARGRLDENLAVLNECPAVCVTVNAYADDRESDKVRLSERRAQSVADYYTSMGVSEDRVRARGLGEAPDSNSKEDPGPGDRNARRAESIPQSCATFIDE